METKLIKYAVKPVIEKLTEVISILKTANSGTERQFLQIGEKLLSNNSAIKDISSAIVLISNITDSSEESGTKNLVGLLAEVPEYIDVQKKAIASGCDALAKIGDILGHLVSNIDGFEKITKKMRMIGISTRIETARLIQDDAGFKALADSIEKLSESIKVKSASIKVKSETLSAFISGVFNKTAEYENKINLNSGTILSDINQGISSLHNEQMICAKNAERVAVVSKDVDRGISDIVTAIQFHDITRQQIEHVHEALLHLTDILGREDEYDAIHTTYEMLRIQCSQLENATNEFSAATERIRSRFVEISQNVKIMANQTAEMAGSNSLKGNTYLADINDGVRDVFRLLSENNAVAEELLKSTSEAEYLFVELSELVEEIEETGTEIHLIAINASIKAAHTGKEGAALGVLADSIQKLSYDSMEQTADVSAILLQIKGISQKLEMTKVQDSKAERQRVLDDISSLLEKIGIDELNLVKNVKYLSESSDRLSRDIIETVKNFNVQEIILSANKKAGGIMEIIRSELNPYIDEEYLGKSRMHLEKYADKYTMQSERLIHHNVAEDSSAEFNQENGQGDFGDNIELF